MPSPKESSPPAAPGPLPEWARAVQEQFRSGAASQFVLYGNVGDVVEMPGESGPDYVSLRRFLDDCMLSAYDGIIHYDRGRGIRVTKGAKDWTAFLSSYADTSPAGLAALTMREPVKALELIDHYVLRSLNLEAIRRTETQGYTSRLAVVIDFAQFIVPRGDAIQLTGDIASHIVKIIGWANDPAIHGSNIVTLLITEKLSDLHSLITENPHTAKVEIKLPGESEAVQYLKWLKSKHHPDLEEKSDVGIDVLAKRCSGLSRVGIRKVVASALHEGGRLSDDVVRQMKKESIEKETQELLEFIESSLNLDYVAGLDAPKAWLRDDATLLRANKLHALPMGYLIAGRIGTGKTFLVQCWAGELGIPCVVFKNFRDKWVGSTEGKLERIFQILRALGQVIVFVDEADQMTGRRDAGSSDSGLSGRVYAMLAKEMSDTRQRGKIIWVFATSRPDLVEVDLKRQGRLDVHIPLFPPQTPDEYRALLLAVAKKLQIPLEADQIPVVPEGSEFGGHEIEGILVRALRIRELNPGGRSLPEVFAQVLKDVKPNAHTQKLAYMDLVAVRECTDVAFLPKKYQAMSPEAVEQRIEELRRFM